MASVGGRIQGHLSILLCFLVHKTIFSGMCSWVTQYGAQRNRCPLEMEEWAGPHGTKTTSVEWHGDKRNKGRALLISF